MKTYLFQRNKLQFAVLILLEGLKTIGTVGVAAVLSIQIDAISHAISSGDFHSLTRCAFISCIYAVSLGVLIFAAEKTKAAYLKRTMLHIRQTLLHGIMEQSIPDYHAANSAAYLTLLGQNIGTFEESYLKNIFSIFESCVSMLAAALLLLYIHPAVAVISMLATAIPSFLPKLYGKRLGSRQREIMTSTAGYTAKIKDILNGFEVLKTYQCEAQAEKLHQSSAHSLEDSKANMANTMAQLYGLTNMASISVQFLIMLLSGFFAVKGLITIGNIIAVTQLTGQVISPAFQLSAKVAQQKAAKPICTQIQDIAVPLESHRKTAPLQEMKKTLFVNDLSFAYGGTPVLKHIHFLFERGKKYAVIGKSGSGKSTLLKLLAGYYGSYTGQILVDGNADLQCDCAFIHQNVFLFDDTIRNNITLYGAFPEDKIQEAVRLAGLEDVLRGLPDGLDTPAAENGARFSGGERQRIAIARALLHKKTVLLVDEATSSLDQEHADHVERSILSLENVTCIAVTHRLDSERIRQYDAVIRLEEGALAEGGIAS